MDSSGTHCYLLFMQLPPDRKERHSGWPQHSELPQCSNGKDHECPLQNADCHFPWLNFKAGINRPRESAPFTVACRSISSTSLLEFLSSPRDEQGSRDSGGGPGASRGQCPSGRYSGNISVTLDSAAQEGRFLLAPVSCGQEDDLKQLPAPGPAASCLGWSEGEI